MTTKAMIRNLIVDVVTGKIGDCALVFVSGEYAGSADRDAHLGTWTAVPAVGEPVTSEGMWSAVSDVISAHLISAVRTVL